jgi:hypothetical protein
MRRDARQDDKDRWRRLVKDGTDVGRAADLSDGLALCGERPETDLGRFQVGRLLMPFSPEQAQEVEITRGGMTSRLKREGPTCRGG